MLDIPGLTPLFTLVSTVLHAYIAILITVMAGIQIWLMKRLVNHETRISHLEGNKKENGSV